MTLPHFSGPEGLRLVLASASPRRRDLLTEAGLVFTVCPSRAAEPDPAPGEGPEAYVERLARLKASEVFATHPDCVVLGADTSVVLDRADGEARILGKPTDAAEALEMLRALSGVTHRVLTGVALLGPGREAVFTVATEVEMAAWPEAMLSAYAATGESLDKAGAYGIQGRGAFLVTAIRGSYTNVVGLPLAMVLEVLVEWGVIVPR